MANMAWIQVQHPALDLHEPLIDTPGAVSPYEDWCAVPQGELMGGWIHFTGIRLSSDSWSFQVDTRIRKYASLLLCIVSPVCIGHFPRTAACVLCSLVGAPTAIICCPFLSFDPPGH